MGMPSTLGRCKMSEIEEKLLKLGYPEIEDIRHEHRLLRRQEIDGGFTCDSRVEKVMLPNPPDNSLGDGGSSLALSALASATASPAGTPAAISGARRDRPGAGRNRRRRRRAGFRRRAPGPRAVACSSSAPAVGRGMGAQGLLQMVLGIVYPSLKPMFEASIRRLTVAVKWKEGPNRRSSRSSSTSRTRSRPASAAGAGAFADAASSAARPPARRVRRRQACRGAAIGRSRF